MQVLHIITGLKGGAETLLCNLCEYEEFNHTIISLSNTPDLKTYS